MHAVVRRRTSVEWSKFWPRLRGGHVSERKHSSGDAARILNIPEPRLADLVRRGKIDPAPTHFAGRRQWNEDQILQAAEYLGLDTDSLRRRLDDEVSRVP